jgi:Lrp/AsnC family transcriptional regulator, leucine-responsive regulatory protein
MSTTVSVAIDDRDRAILRVLQADGRVTNAELAARVNLSESACLRRLRALEEAGVIAGYTALLDRAAVGLSLDVFVTIALSSQAEAALAAFEAAVRGASEVLECHLTTGDADYLLRVAARDVGDLERIHARVLTRLPHVARINSSIVMRTVRRTTALPVD